MSSPFTVTVDRTQFRTALKHGFELWHDDSTPKKRLDQRGGNDGFTRYTNCRVRGKLAEVAFVQFLRQEFDVDGSVDWRVYGDYDTTDDGDIQYLIDEDGTEVDPAADVEIKKTKSFNSWLAIRESAYERHPDDAPIVVCTMYLDEDVDVDEWQPWGEWPAEDWKFEQRLRNYEEKYFPLDIQIEGAVYKDEFTHHFDAGDNLFDPNDPDHTYNATMRMSNEAVPMQDLPNDQQRWERVVDDIVGDHDIDPATPEW